MIVKKNVHKRHDRKKKFKFLLHEICGHGPSKQPKVWASVSVAACNCDLMGSYDHLEHCLMLG